MSIDGGPGTHGGHSVEVEGSFDSWATRHSLQHSGKDFTLVKLLAPGVYQVYCHNSMSFHQSCNACLARASN